MALQVLYGIPCVGKSTTAVQFAGHHGIRTIIHTDYVREVQRRFAPPDQTLALAKVTHDAWELHGPPTRPNIEAGFLDHVTAVSAGIEVVVAKVVGDGVDAVIEGAHFHGSLIQELRRANTDADIDATLLVVRTADELRQRVMAKEAARTVRAGRKRWQERLPILLALQDFLIANAQAHGITVATPDEWRRSWPPRQARYSTSTTS